eukprot:COSAG01_NODE_499_length_16240_cov_43.337092_10_plen_132_part_00
MARRGDLIVINAHVWHAGCANRSEQPKPALHLFFCRRDKPQQQHQRRLIPAQVKHRMGPALRWVCALDDAENEAAMAQARELMHVSATCFERLGSSPARALCRRLRATGHQSAGRCQQSHNCSLRTYSNIR